MNAANHSADVLVVGGGLAGLAASITARSLGASVVLIDKHCMGKPSCTYLSVGAFREVGEGYTVEQFIRDTLEAGRQLNNLELVEVLARESASAIRRLESLGVKFEHRRGVAVTVEARGIARGYSLIEKLIQAAEKLGVKPVAPHRASRY